MTGSNGTLTIQALTNDDREDPGDTLGGTSLDAFLGSVERRALHMARLATGDVEEALDIVQDAMMNFVRRYRRKPSEEWPPLFFRTVDNRIKDFYRRRSVRSRWRVWLRGDDERRDDLIHTAPDPSPIRPDIATSGDQFGDALESALKSLPDRQRQAFLMRSWQGLSVAETASAMGCSEGSVKTHLSRALSALRQRLGDHR
jgi:RNA polymerase sigma-70 factor (ECF subfamily)